MKFLLRVIIPSPLIRWFDYLPLAGTLTPVGCRVEVPFGNRSMIGLVAEHLPEDQAAIALDKLKPINQALDANPIVSKDDLALARWIASYYCAPPGDTLPLLLPKALREGKALNHGNIRFWERSDSEPEAFGRAKAQESVWLALEKGPRSHSELINEFSGPAVKALAEKGLITAIERLPQCPLDTTLQSAPILNQEQIDAVAHLKKHHAFNVSLLFGITGSGKTEVYLQWAEYLLKAKKQVLVLVPEIGLTPQTVARFTKRLAYPVATWHSGMTDDEKLNAWRWARSGEARLIIGTRSAVLLPFENLGAVIIDEEHDASYKQQDGMKYSARDTAIMRASRLNIPVLLGSATPSLETLANTQNGRYHTLTLTQRATGVHLPQTRIMDCRGHVDPSGLAHESLHHIEAHLNKGHQVMVFQNRRGYAPVVICGNCGWQGNCQRCDAKLTLHRGINVLRCHHCGHEQRVPPTCPDCGSEALQSIGVGTEKLEEGLSQRFPNIPVIRIDRDTTRRKGELERLLEKAANTKPAILLGTQMLAKGHHFSDLSLVVIVDVDQGLFSADLRGPERMGQVLLQVAGRAGREKSGQVLVQSRCPDHPYFEPLLAGDYLRFANTLLGTRKAALMPPFCFMASIRAYAKVQQDVLNYLQWLSEQLGHPEGVMKLGPAPNAMERRAGYFRWQLLLTSDQREPLHKTLHQVIRLSENGKLARKVRWSIDVDPQELL